MVIWVFKVSDLDWAEVDHHDGTTGSYGQIRCVCFAVCGGGDMSAGATVCWSFTDEICRGMD